ncbi:MAG TPA: PD-(D/E)XK nuclease family protein [Ignavibacteria bacterium]|nr:PD-(D/E)XK nuclease family protein [Ignavibacteria bacterium]HMR39314.1 PD-(D/E)XK nuclease family protein [Ignavibacteria bacterium]
MLRKSKTIQELFNEVSGYELVITNDAPLATALNKLVSEPRLGYLAMTPKQIAKKFADVYYEKIYDKTEIILSIFKSKKIPLNLLHQTIKKIYEIWMYNAKSEFVSFYLSDDEKVILDLLKEYDTIESLMENFNEDYYGSKNIAVIGEELFSLLDMEVLIKKGKPADRIELFLDEKFSPDKTYVFNSDESLARSIAELISEENADETAIVLNIESEYLEIIKSLIKKKGLQIEEKYYLKDDLSVRTFISFLEISSDIENIELKEIIPLANEFGIRIPPEFNNYNAGIYVRSLNKNKELKSLYDICMDINNMNFNKLLETLKVSFDYNINPALIEMMELSGFENTKISEKSIADLRYILREFDMDTGSEKTGILFVNALNSAFIDRKIIFYIGLDESWMRIYPDKDYLNKEEEEEKNRMRFQILIQQGEKKYYFVRNVRDYEEVIPCYYFSILSEEKADSFDDKYFAPVYVNDNSVNKLYKPEKGKITFKPVNELKNISPTGLNNFYRCPKLYSLNKLFPYEVNPAMKRGILFHNFAEMYFNHPEFTIEKFDEILDVMTEEMSVFVKNINTEFVRSDFRLGAESVMSFLNEMKINKTPSQSPSGKTENILMDRFGLKKIYINTEKWIRGNDNSLINGKIDLQYENKIVDYKSSSVKKGESEVTYQSNIDYIEENEYENFDFQAIAYISFQREVTKEVEFIYNFLFFNYRNQINPDNKLKECLTKIRYFDMNFSDHIRTDRFYEYLITDEKSAKLPAVIGRENYNYILDNLNLNELEYFEKDKLYGRFNETSLTIIKELQFTYKDFNCMKQVTLIKNVLMPVAKKIYAERTGGGEYGTVFKNDCDAFLNMAKDKLAEINQYNKTKFPAEPVFGSRDVCKNCEYLNLCSGNKLWH